MELLGINSMFINGREFLGNFWEFLRNSWELNWEIGNNSQFPNSIALYWGITKLWNTHWAWEENKILQPP